VDQRRGKVTVFRRPVFGLDGLQQAGRLSMVSRQLNSPSADDPAGAGGSDGFAAVADCPNRWCLFI
jgi:hypothetical protein